MNPKSTVFDEILAGNRAHEPVFEDDHVLAFNDIRPQAPVHVLVVPKKKRASVAEYVGATFEEAGALFVSIAKVAHHLGLEEEGYRVVFNHGRDAQQTVAYVHAHILAGRPMRWPPG